MQAKYAQTMTGKLKNTIAFGPNAQFSDDYTGKEYGLLGQGGGLKIN